jgi:hypothetical protein
MKAISKLRKISDVFGVINKLPKQRAVYKASEVAYAFGVSVSSVYGWLSEGVMNHVRIGIGDLARIRITHDSVVQMLESLTKENTGKSSPPRKREAPG